MFFFKPCQCLCYSICLTPVKCQVNTQWCVYVAIAPSWWATKHPHFHTNLPPREIPFIATRRTNDAHRINSNVDRVHQWLQCAVFWKEEQKTSKNYDIYDPIKKGYCIFCIKLPFLPLNTSNFLKRSNHIIFFNSISKDPKRNEPHGNSIAELQGIFEACRLVLFHKEMSQPGATITNHWTKR